MEYNKSGLIQDIENQKDIHFSLSLQSDENLKDFKKEMESYSESMFFLLIFKYI